METAKAAKASGPVALAISISIALTSVAVGFATDDYGFRAALDGGRRGPLDLFRFAAGGEETQHAIARGLLPWWTAPSFELRFMRPLTGALFALDVRLFGDHPLGYHLHSLVWLLALLLGARLVFVRALPRTTATLALAVFAFRSAHVLPYAWISARHVLVAAVPATFAVALFLGRRGRWLSLPLLLVAFLGSEAALASIPFFVTLAIVRSRDEAALPPLVRGLLRGLLRGLPFVLLAVAYLAVYRLLGFGARGSGGYHDPLSSPLSFLRVAALRVPALLADALVGVPITTASATHEAAYAAVGIAGALLVRWLLVSSPQVEDAELRALRWLVPAAALGLVVGATGMPGGRVLVLPDLGFSALVAVVVRHAFAAGARVGIRRILRRLGGALLVFQHLVAAPLVCLRAVHELRRTARAAEVIARDAEIGDEARPRVFLVGASDPFVFLYPRSILAARDPGRVRCFTPLSGARADERVTRTGPSTITIESLGSPMLEGFDALFRDPNGPAPLSAGDTVRSCGATVRVASASRGRPRKIEVTFDAGSPVVLLAWNGTRLVRFTLPEPGAAAIVPWMPGPSRS